MRGGCRSAAVRAAGVSTTKHMKGCVLRVMMRRRARKGAGLGRRGGGGGGGKWAKAECCQLAMQLW